MKRTGLKLGIRQLEKYIYLVRKEYMRGIVILHSRLGGIALKYKRKY